MSNGSLYVKTIKLDIDIPYDLWESLFYRIYIRKYAFCTELLEIKVDTIAIRKSRNGNIHIYMTLKKPIDAITYYQFKYCIGEDHKRLVWSWKRYIKTGKILDFFWNKPIEVKKNVCKENKDIAKCNC